MSFVVLYAIVVGRRLTRINEPPKPKLLQETCQALGYEKVNEINALNDFRVLLACAFGSTPPFMIGRKLSFMAVARG